jgi:hypothetical protein
MTRDGTAVGHHRSTVIIGGYSLLTARESNHYPVSVQVQPGRELCVRVEFDVDVFDEATIDALFARLRKLLVAMTGDLGQPS